MQFRNTKSSRRQRASTVNEVQGGLALISSAPACRQSPAPLLISNNGLFPMVACSIPMSPSFKVPNLIHFAFHRLLLLSGKFGLSGIAQDIISPDTTIASCPFSLIIHAERALHALTTILGESTLSDLQSWSERQLICTYICFHWIMSDSRCV